MNRKSIILFVSLFLVFIFFLFFQQNRMKKQMQLKIQFIEQKNILRDELDDLIDQHDNLLDEYGDLNEQLSDKDAVIQEQIAEIKDLIRTKDDLTQASEKIEKLRVISKRYLANIDSLLLMNEELIYEKDSVVKVNRSINWKNYKLNQQNEKLSEKVSKGSILDFLHFDAVAIRYRSTGKEVTTKKANKVQKIRLCFSVGANLISESEMKNLYFQIIDPLNNIISFDNKAIAYIQGDSIVCTGKELFMYNNNLMDHCFFWERVQVLSPGIYKINLFLEGVLAAKTELKLK